MCKWEKEREKKRNQGSSRRSPRSERFSSVGKSFIYRIINKIIIRTMPFSFSFFLLFLIILIKKQPFLINYCLECHAMPVTGVRMPTSYAQEGHWKLDYLRPGVQSDRAADSSRRARAQRVHQRRLPWHPHAYRTALRVSPASNLSERYLSFPPNFTTFGHFLKPTITWNVLTKPSSTLFMRKKLGPLESGTESKKKRRFGLA